MRHYIGDGAYVEWDGPGWPVVVTTSNGIEDTNRIVLEPSVWDSLLTVIESIRKGQP